MILPPAVLHKCKVVAFQSNIKRDLARLIVHDNVVRLPLLPMPMPVVQPEHAYDVSYVFGLPSDYVNLDRTNWRYIVRASEMRRALGEKNPFFVLRGKLLTDIVLVRTAFT